MVGGGERRYIASDRELETGSVYTLNSNINRHHFRTDYATDNAVCSVCRLELISSLIVTAI